MSSTDPDQFVSTTRFYLAARYSRRQEMLGVRDAIQNFHVGVVTSRWINGEHQLDDRGTPIGEDGAALVEKHALRDGEQISEYEMSQRAAELRAKFARDDFEDVRAADVVIAFTEEPRATASRGGRHVELGMALALNKRVIVVGPRENVFCWLPEVRWFPDWMTLASELVRPITRQIAETAR